MRTTPPVDDRGLAMLEDEMHGLPDSQDFATLPADAKEKFHVIVCGAGFSGICMAVKLKAAGIPHTVLEKSDGIGGTWKFNQYPDAGCDVPSHLYSLSFGPNANWSGFFSKAPEIHSYLE